MTSLLPKTYYGTHQRIIETPHIHLTETIYTHSKVDWHYHQRAYFTYLLKGKLFEANKKESYNLVANDLVFHNHQEAHYNIKPDEEVKGFHLELENDFFEVNDSNISSIEGTFLLQNSKLKQFFHQIYLDSLTENTSQNNLFDTSISILLLSIFDNLKKTISFQNRLPVWVNKIQEIMSDENSETISLTYLAHQLNLHPVYLSRSFTHYFGCSFSEYYRTFKIQKSLQALQNKKISISQIAYQNQFADQSHYIRCFKKSYGLTPLEYRKIIIG